MVNLLACNLRWNSWFAGTHALPVSSHAPWTVDYLILFFFGTGRLGWWLRSRFMAVADARSMTKWVLAAYLGLLLCGAAVLTLVR